MIKQFTTYLVSIRGYSQNTALAYESDCKAFAVYTRERRPNARWSNITRDDVDAYVIHLSKDMKSGRTINRHIASISAIFNYMKRKGLNVENPCKYESRQKLAKTLPNVLNPTELQMAIKYAGHDAAIIIRLIYATGMRLQEVIDMSTQDVNWDACSIIVRGKGSKERVVYMDTETRDALAEYVQGKSACPFGHFRQRKIREMVYEALRPYCRGRQLSPHAIRHTFATEQAKKGMSTTTLAMLLGHERLETTQKYVNLGVNDVQQLYFTFNN